MPESWIILHYFLRIKRQVKFILYFHSLKVTTILMGKTTKIIVKVKVKYARHYHPPPEMLKWKCSQHIVCRDVWWQHFITALDSIHIFTLICISKAIFLLCPTEKVLSANKSSWVQRTHTHTLLVAVAWRWSWLSVPTAGDQPQKFQEDYFS